jgi:hypothetical protein
MTVLKTVFFFIWKKFESICNPLCSSQRLKKSKFPFINVLQSINDLLHVAYKQMDWHTDGQTNPYP